MGVPAITVSEVSKRYRLGRPDASSFRESVTRILSSPSRLLALFGDRRSKEDDDTFWALRDVSFHVQQGEVVGIVGRNGAGKSTLLKVLSRITEPTSGRVTLHGRIASLLEVGTGFHPELSGRENIYLNGAILGMKRTEIQRRFDDIVGFAEVERFIDTSVKHYSSGMYMRLAFSVAAHLEPEILVVDEVLAVGDASFQRKCLAKMDAAGKSGRTVIFVSHNMPAVTRLCSRAIMLDKGRVYTDGPAAQVASIYLRSGLGSVAVREWKPSEAPANDIVRMLAVRVQTDANEISDTIDIRSEVRIEMDYEVLTAGTVLVPNFGFYNDDGVCIFLAHDMTPEWRRVPRPMGIYRSVVHVPGNFFSEGTVIVGAALSTHDPVILHVHVGDALAFQIVDKAEGDTARGDFVGSMPGVVRPKLKWTTAEMGARVVSSIGSL
jgi:lipopolysaccharide transport system ATP-binding protein